MADDEAVDHRRRAPHRPLHVAEQDQAVDVGLVGGGVDIGLVEDHRLAVAPAVAAAVDVDPAGVAVRRAQAEMVAQAARERIAVGA